VFGDAFLRLDAGRTELSQALDAIFSGLDARMSFDFVHYAKKTPNEPGVSRDLARIVSAKRIAQRFRRIKDAAVASGDPEAIKSSSSMAILLRTMKHADVYADALREVGIDSVVTGGSVFAQTNEAFLVSALLNVAANPADEESLFNVLTSDMFDISDKALTSLCFGHPQPKNNGEGEKGCTAISGGSGTEGGSRKYVRRASLSRGFFSQIDESDTGISLSESEEKALLLARSVLIDFRQEVAGGSVASALRKLFAHSGYLYRKRGVGERIPAADISSVANISKAIQIVENLEADVAGPASLAAAFAIYLDTEAEAPGALALEGSDFVQIMTIHASKGLEFDHIAIAELGDSQQKTSTLALDNIDGSTFLALRPPSFSMDEVSRKNGDAVKKFTFEEDDDDTVDLSLLDSEELKRVVCESEDAAQQAAALRAYCSAQDQAELRRIYYVALTRARESALVEFLAQMMPVKSKGEHCTYSGIMADTYYAVMNRYNNGSEVTEAEFKRRDADITTSRIYLTSSNIDEHLAPSANQIDVATDSCLTDGEALEEAGTEMTFPRYVESNPCSTIPANLGRKGLYSYTSLAAFEPKETSQGRLSARATEVLQLEGNSAIDVSLVFDGVDFDADSNTANLATQDSAQVYVSADEDKACAFGSAFHTLVQMATLKSCGALPSMPTDTEIAMHIKKNGLGVDAAHRLKAALALWLNSDCAAEFFKEFNVDPEVPFCTCIKTNKDQPSANVSLPEMFYLEGEIDALRVEGDSAWFIDYKTGGIQGDRENLRTKHGFQAQCYAYALLCAGYKKVRATFVKVEQIASSNNADVADTTSHSSAKGEGSEPLTVDFTFGEKDMDNLRGKIVEAYIAATGMLHGE
jgi:ATP-dependent exoDNAse (exonuclease V) beta subunit